MSHSSSTRVPPPSWQVWSALGIVYVVWGSTYLAIVYVVESLPPMLGAAMRFAAATLLLGTYLLLRRGPSVFRVARRPLLTAAGIGVLLLAGGNGGVTLAEQQGLPSGLAALLVAALPLLVVLLRFAAHDRPSNQTLVGVGVGLVGLGVLLLPGSRPEGVSILAALLVVAGTVSWAIGSFAATRLPLPADPLVTVVVEMAGGAVALVLLSLLRGESLDVASVQASSWWALAYLAVFGSVVAFSAYSWLLGNVPVSTVATYAYVNPVVAVVLGAVFVGEAVTATTAIGGLITLLAVAVVVTEESRRRRRPAVAPDPGQEPLDLQGRASSSAT